MVLTPAPFWRNNHDSIPASKGTVVNSVYVSLAISGFLLLILGCVSWRHHDVSGECMVLNSGDIYLYELNQDCKDPNSNTACACPGATTMKECMVTVCNNRPNADKIPDPTFGQCYAGPLAISSGTFALAAALCGFLLVKPFHKTFNLSVSSVLILCALGCGIASAAMSFWRWGQQENSQGKVVDRATVDFGSCGYTYSDARSDYKAMTAFGFITALIAIIAGASEAVHWSGIKIPEGHASGPEQDLFL